MLQVILQYLIIKNGRRWYKSATAYKGEGRVGTLERSNVVKEIELLCIQ